jgi:hypothetical protein
MPAACRTSKPKRCRPGSTIFVTRRLGSVGFDPYTFEFRRFWPLILSYRRPLAHVLVA